MEKNKDPINILGDWLISEKIASQDELKNIREDIENEAHEAVLYALDAKYPNLDEVDMHVFTEAS